MKKIRDEAIDIVRKYAGKSDFENLTVDKAAENITRLSNTYSIDANEAASVYEVKLKKQAFNKNQSDLDLAPTRLISEFDKENQMGNIVCEICSTYQPASDENRTEVIVQDISGRANLILNNDVDDLCVELGETYSLTNVIGVCREKNYVLKPTEETNIQQLEDSTEPTSTSIRIIEGRITQITPISGLIRRCGQDNCNKILDVDFSCPDHGDCNGVWDLRVGFIVDDGKNPEKINLGRILTNELADITLDEAIEKDREDILMSITKTLVGQYGVFILNENIGHEEHTYVESFQLSPPIDLAKIGEAMEKAEEVENGLNV